MLSVSCKDVGVDCDFRGTGETEEELMNNLVDHAIKDHGYTREYVMKPEMQEKIKSKIKKSWKYGSTCLDSVVNAKTLTIHSFCMIFHAIWKFSWFEVTLNCITSLNESLEISNPLVYRWKKLIDIILV